MLCGRGTVVCDRDSVVMGSGAACAAGQCCDG